ncbi:MAG: GxxExxY protein [Chloroflexi bacterium]|nr:GxxExxY protein [Chloroflexota bacterium]
MVKLEGLVLELTTEHKAAAAFEHDELTYRINGAAIEVHRELGACLFESIYENALCIEFEKRGIRYQRQKRFQVEYQGQPVGHMVVDLVIEEEVIVELKSVKELLPIHEAQLIAYLKAAKLKTGLLINFNVRLLKSGIKRISV